MPAIAAAVLVFLSSAAVLVLEILAARLLAPYVGVTLEVYTAIIGTILAGIAFGSWWGGRWADRRDPRQLIGPFLVVGGGLSFMTIPVVDALGTGLRGAGALTTVVLTFAAFFAPATVLTAVTPAVIKLELADLAQTGRVVGRLSAVGTAGAIIGTFVTGFLLVAAVPTRPTIRVVAAFLVLLGIATAAWLHGGRRATSAGTIVAVLFAGAFSFAARHPCDHESAYYCARIEVDADDPSGRSLVLDTLRHSYVDLDDPTHLEFTYIQWFGDVITAVAPDGAPVDALHIGGGGYTMPRYLRAAHQGSASTVLEVDPLLVELAHDELGLEPGADIETLVGDARLTIGEVQADTYDLVINDAFGGVSVPWHLATREFLDQVDDAATDDAVMVANVIDYGPRDFLRAYVATTRAVFDHVAVVGRPGSFAGRDARGLGGNFVMIASDAPLPLDDIREANRRGGRDAEVLAGGDLDEFVGDAAVLTDDYAPVDQLLTPLPDG
ncbi:MAG TPA: fused MFS/spermidine synthase [Egicoccus sp.]|nr:fused MFS/spermidine synthase [Egicoccus sp.]HSK23963.1 fused MFS/spermidine synthase [Egicoccus sp.]